MKPQTVKGAKSTRDHIADIMADGRARTANDIQIKCRALGIVISQHMIAEVMGQLCKDGDFRSSQHAGITCWQSSSNPRNRAPREPVGTVSRRRENEPAEWLPVLYKIVDLIASQTSVSAHDILGRDTSWRIANARAAAMHACWRVGGFNYSQIGQAFQRDSSGVGRAIREYAYACNAEAAE